MYGGSLLAGKGGRCDVVRQRTGERVFTGVARSGESAVSMDAVRCARENPHGTGKRADSGAVADEGGCQRTVQD